MKQQIHIRYLIPVLFGFFVMGFIDLVGISSNYVKHDFHLNDTTANILLIMVFFWFAILSVPTGIFITGFGLANIFPIIFSIALLKMPEHKNEISGLMMMGIVGGAVIPPLMGLASDNYGQTAAMLVLLACLFYFLMNSLRIKTKKELTKQEL